MKSRVAPALVALVLASTPAWAEKISEDFRAEFQRQVRKRTYVVVLQKGIPTVPINGVKNDQSGAATFGVDIVSASEWRSSTGLMDSNQQIGEFLDPGEMLEVVDVTFKDNRVDLRTISTEAKKITRGAWILKTENRETVSTNFKFFFPEQWKGRYLTREDVPAALDYISNWLRPFPDEASAKRFSAQIVAGDMPAAGSGSTSISGSSSARQGVPAEASASRTTATAAPAKPAATTAPRAAAPTQTVKKEIKVGMTALEVVDIMGKPQKQVTFGNTEKWTYADITVLFENGKVKDVKF